METNPGSNPRTPKDQTVTDGQKPEYHKKGLYNRTQNDHTVTEGQSLLYTMAQTQEYRTTKPLPMVKSLTYTKRLKQTNTK